MKIRRISKYRLEKVCGHLCKKAAPETRIEQTSGSFLQKSGTNQGLPPYGLGALWVGENAGCLLVCIFESYILKRREYFIRWLIDRSTTHKVYNLAIEANSYSAIYPLLPFLIS
jgi:hypothetical protein